MFIVFVFRWLWINAWEYIFLVDHHPFTSCIYIYIYRAFFFQGPPRFWHIPRWHYHKSLNVIPKKDAEQSKSLSRMLVHWCVLDIFQFFQGIFQGIFGMTEGLLSCYMLLDSRMSTTHRGWWMQSPWNGRAGWVLCPGGWVYPWMGMGLGYSKSWPCFWFVKYCNLPRYTYVSMYQYVCIYIYTIYIYISYIYVYVAPIVECILYTNIYIFIIHVCVIKIYLRTISTCHPCVALKPTFCFWNHGAWKGWSAHTIAEYLSIPSLDKGLFELNNVEYIFFPLWTIHHLGRCFTFLGGHGTQVDQVVVFLVRTQKPPNHRDLTEGIFGRFQLPSFDGDFLIWCWPIHRNMDHINLFMFSYNGLKHLI